MTQLTDQLGTDFSVKPVREPPAPSTGLATALGAIGKGLDVFAEDRRRSAVAKRQADEDAYKAQERRLPTIAQNAIEEAQRKAASTTMVTTADGVNAVPFDSDLAGAPSNIFGSVVDPLPSGIMGSAQQAVNKLTNIQAAISQNKMPTISLNAAINQQFSSLMNQYPDHGEAIAKYFRERGFNASLDRGILDEQNTHEAGLKAELQWEERARNVGRESLDPAIWSQMSDAEVIAHGAKQQNSAFLLEQASKEANLTLANQNISAGEKKQAEDLRDDTISQQTVVDAWNNSGPIMTALQQVSGAITKLPIGEQQAAFDKLAPQYDQWAGNYKANALAKARAGGLSSEKYAALSTQLDDMISRGRSLWSGDMSVAASNQRALTSLSTSVNLKTAEAMPVFFALTKMGMRPDEIDGYAQALRDNPALGQALAKEIRGFTGEFGQKNASTHLKDIVDILKGRVTLADFTPEEARVKMPVLYSTTRDLVTKYAAGNPGIDTDTVLHGVGEMVTAARTLSPGTASLNTLTVATGGIASQNTWKSLIRALKDPVHNDQAEATISGSRAASVTILNALQPELHAHDNRFWELRVNKETGRAEVVHKAVADPLKGVASTLTVQAKAYAPKDGPVPAGMKVAADTFNTNINNLVALNNYDPNGLKSVTPLEVAKYYGAGVVPKSMQEGKGKAPVNPRKEIDTALSALEDAFSHVPEMNQPVSIVDSIISAEGSGKNPRSSAEGPGQFTHGTFRDVMSRIHPEVTLPANNAELAPFKDKYGKEATSAYARENRKVLADAGLPVTAATTYLMHFAGPEGGVALLKASPDTPVEQVLGQAAVNANPQLKGKTVAETIQWATNFITKRG